MPPPRQSPTGLRGGFAGGRPSPRAARAPRPARPKPPEREPGPRLSGRAMGLVGMVAGGLFVFLVVLGPSNASKIAEAADKTASYPGARIDLATSMRSPALEGSIDMAGSGLYNGRTERVRMRLHLIRSPQLPPGVEESDLTMRAIAEGATQYLSSPMLAREMPAGKSWMRIDLPPGLVDGATTQQGDPRDYLRMLKATNGRVWELGEERVRGAATTHYRAVVDLRAHAERLREQGFDAAAAQLERSVEDTDAGSVVDVWIDERSLIRRMIVAVPLGPSAPGGQMVVEMEMYAFGVEPEISLPPEERVYDATELVEGRLGGSGASGEVGPHYPHAPSRAGEMSPEWVRFAEAVDRICATNFNRATAISQALEVRATLHGWSEDRQTIADLRNWQAGQRATYEMTGKLGPAPQRPALFRRWRANVGLRAKLFGRRARAWAAGRTGLEGRFADRVDALKARANHLGQRFGLRDCTSNGPGREPVGG